MKWPLLLILLSAVYVVRHDPGRDVPVQFDGLSRQRIKEMYQKDKISFDFVSEKTYRRLNAVTSKPQAPRDPKELREAILKAKDRTKTPDERLDALIKALAL